MYKKKDGVIVNYHGPYVDSSGEKFYLPRKWTLCPMTSASDDGKTQCRYKECGINYSFKPNEMKGGDLMRNLWWLGQFGCLRTLLDRDADEVNDECGDNALQPKLPPTKYNLSRYVAFFPDYQLDNGNVL